MGKTQLERVAIMETQVTQLKEDVQGIRKDVTDIKDNHLPSLQRKLDGLTIRITTIVAVITFFISLIVPELIKVLFE